MVRISSDVQHVKFLRFIHVMLLVLMVLISLISLHVSYKTRNQLQRFTETCSNMDLNPESEAEPELVQF